MPMIPISPKQTQLSDTCSPWEGWSEDRHRKALLEGDPASAEHHCHLTQLDSPGYSKYLKELAGTPDQECHTQGMPRRRIVFIRTHKTGSSSITNIMHRASIRLRLRPLLPLNNYYFSWPQLDMLEKMYSPIPNIPEGKQYEMLVSAHTRLHFPSIDKLVPDAAYITIVRDPVKHFISSWNYWHTSDHIFAKTGKRVTMEEFLSDPKGHWHMLEQTDINVLQNSMAFDLGLPHEPTHAQVENLIQSIFDRFTLVMVTDYMDESMVMLRRELCWFLSDVVHIPLKASSTTNSLPVSDKVAQSIRKLNWADAVIFDVMNKTFWERVHSEVHFNEELVRYRSAMATVTQPCEQYADQTDDEHRKFLLDANLKRPDTEATCRMRLLDSVGFVKLLKRRNGIIEPECHTQGRKRGKIVFIKTHKTASSTLVNIMHRFAWHNNLRVVLPKDNMFLGWPYYTVDNMVQHYGDSKRYDMFVSGHSRYKKSELDLMVPGGQYVTIMRDPVAHFLSSWWHWHVADHITANGATAPSMNEFVENPDKWWNYTKWTDKWLIHNSMAYDLGLDGEPTQDQTTSLIAEMDDYFSMVLITERMDESLVLLRRTLCWDMDDIVYLSLKVTPDEARLNPDPKLVRAIRKFNQVDTQLYSHFQKRLEERISREVDFDTELAEFRARQQKIQTDCQEYTTYPEDQLRKELLQNEISDSVRKCMLMALDSKGFVKLIKRKVGAPFVECSSNTNMPLSQFALVNLHTFADDVFANVALRYAMTHSLSVIAPAKGKQVISLKGKNGFEQLRTSKTSNNEGPPNILASPYSGSVGQVRQTLLPAVRITLVLQDPVSRFMEAWDRLNVPELLAEWVDEGNTLTMEEFLEDPSKWLQNLSPDARVALENPVSNRFGLDLKNRNTDGVTEAQTVYENTNILLSAEHIDESLVVMRRWMCWSSDDMVIGTKALQELKPDPLHVSDSVATAIRNLNWADQVIYTHLMDLFRSHLATLVDFESEIAQIREARLQIDTSCDGTKGPSAARLARSLRQPQAPSHCDLVALNVADFTKLLRKMNSA